MALMHAMQSAHTSVEAALGRILEMLGEEAPAGDRSHADLVRRVARPVASPGRGRPAILSAELAADLDESRRFRHRASHDYDNFDPSRALPAMAAARRLSATLAGAIATFREIVDPPSPDA
ncbi:hypothetical protein [Jiella sonneratiae]|uniref:HepT-like domain-containing protein n=1 Tax=Jiella sonneratiae TaxID=2816856 RepID=A0ABS3J737_9HYPH|nr:hypothetical protein [Jiella sonneratiae]MBO0904406.1 hypothetical protein [Jiella sonneratiae]